jgi:uncharacterized membrane protein
MSRWDDTRMEAAVGTLLRVGVLVAASVTLVGTVLHLVAAGHTPAPGHVFVGEPTDLRTIPGVVHDALAWRPRGIMQLGVLLLIATPIARVALLIVAFALERDRLYVGVSAFVLAVLLHGLLGTG